MTSHAKSYVTVRLEDGDPPADMEWHLQHFATAFACVDAEAGERVIGSLLAQAFGDRRFADATFWQRVKLHARMVRAVPGWTSRISAAPLD